MIHHLISYFRKTSAVPAQSVDASCKLQVVDNHQAIPSDITEDAEPPVFVLASWLDVKEDDVEDIRVLVDNQTGTISSCNETAWTLLVQLKKGATKLDLVARLSAEFQVTRQQATHDVNQFFRHLNALGLINEAV